MVKLNDKQRLRFEEAIRRLDGDEGTLVMLADMVAEDAPMILESLIQEIDTGELAAAAKTGHALKGLLSTFETASPVSDLQPLIEAARFGDLKQSKNQLSTLRIPLQELIGEIKQLSQV